MGFYADFIAEARRNGAAWEAQHRMGRCPCRQHDFESYQIHLFGTIATQMRQARIVRIGGEQAQVFLDQPRVEGQDYTRWLRLPYPRVYLHLDPAIPFTNYKGECDHTIDPDNYHAYVRSMFPSQFPDEPSIKGVLLAEPWALDTIPLPRIAEQLNIDVNAVDRTFQVIFLIPLPDYMLNLHISTAFILKDGTMRWWRGGQTETRVRMLTWAIHVVNFLSSPSVKLVFTNPPPALQKARVRRGKEPLPGWYEITYRKILREYTREKASPKRWEHTFRYDVRGHFKRFERGPMEGRVIWCPPHQRGLKHSLYKPKVYRTPGPIIDQVETWKGD